MQFISTTTGPLNQPPYLSGKTAKPNHRKRRANLRHKSRPEEIRQFHAAERECERAMAAQRLYEFDTAAYHESSRDSYAAMLHETPADLNRQRPAKIDEIPANRGQPDRSAVPTAQVPRNPRWPNLRQARRRGKTQQSSRRLILPRNQERDLKPAGRPAAKIATLKPETHNEQTTVETYRPPDRPLPPESAALRGKDQWGGVYRLRH